MTSLRAVFVGAAVCAVAATGLLTTFAPLRAEQDAITRASSELPIIHRTEFGVPHIVATDFHGVGLGLGYAQTEDYGERVIKNLLRAKGWMGRTYGHDSIASDFTALKEQGRVDETYHLLDPDTRAIYEGFAEGVNMFIRINPTRVPSWARPVFTGHDVAALDIGNAGIAAAERIVDRVLKGSSSGDADGDETENADGDETENAGAYSEDGSNAWAFGPSRTKSGRAMLLRNPHLSWTAGYWEAHVTLPGKLDFYGDFRIGGPFTVVAGFNRDLGWATTNNATNNDVVYALEVDPYVPDAYRFDGVTIPLKRESVTAEFTTPIGMQRESREYWSTPLGPVVRRTDSLIYIVRGGTEGDFRAGEQFLAMMRARSLTEWKSALAMRARSTSNLTYADRDGNILTIWMASLPSLPHRWGADSAVTTARVSADVWTHLVPLDSLPQTLNPKSGYVHNENDAPYYANLEALLDPASYPDNVERGELRLRSQLALQLIDTKDKLSLEDMIARKHSMRMLLADRVKPDLLRAARSALDSRSAGADSNLAQGVKILEAWDNTVAPTSRGGLLFETWWRRYQSQARDSAYAVRWSLEELTTTPRGVGKPALAVAALTWAVDEERKTHGSPDVAWGDVHRVIRGKVDVPVGGCSGALGCFRVLSYEQLPDGRRAASTGDGWVLAVEFGARAPRAYSILAYGENSDSTSQHYDDQAAMFARGEFKPVWFLSDDVVKHAERSYRPGER